MIEPFSVTSLELRSVVKNKLIGDVDEKGEFLQLEERKHDEDGYPHQNISSSIEPKQKLNYRVLVTNDDHY
jgi:hypothetical protein